MTDDPRTPHDPPPATITAAEDDVVSAVLDGEATAEERDAVLGDPRLRARLRELERLRSATADAPPLAPSARDEILTRALDAAAITPSVGAGDELAGRRAEAARRRARVLVAGAAVAVVLLAVPLLVLALGDRDGRVEDASETAESVAPESEAPEPGDASSLGAATDGPAELGDVGSVDDLQELRAAVDAAPRAPASSTTAPDASSTARAGDEQFAVGAVVTCREAVVAAHTDLGAPVAVATATLAGEPVLVLVFGRDPVTIVVADASCRTVARDAS